LAYLSSVFLKIIRLPSEQNQGLFYISENSSAKCFQEISSTSKSKAFSKLEPFTWKEFNPWIFSKGI